MLGSGFRLYMAYDDPATDLTSPIAVDGYADATDGTVISPGTLGINEIIAAGDLRLVDVLTKDVTEAGNPNTINTTTRATGRKGVQSSEITSVNPNLTVQLVYAAHTAYETAVAGYEVLDILEYCQETNSAIYVIDLDKALSTAGSKGRGGNYTVALSQPREVEGQVVYDVTFALRDYYQRLEYDALTASAYVARTTPV